MKRRQLVFGVLMPFFFGILSFFYVEQRPRFELIHAVDVIQLLAAGLCFGVALVGLLILIRGVRVGP